MDTYKQKNDESPIRVFKPSGMMQFGLGLVIVLLVIHFSVMMNLGAELGMFMFLLLFFYAFIIWLLMISMSQQHLAIYEDGLEYRMGGNRIFSRWEDLQRFESRASGKSRILGIATLAVEKRQEGNAFERFLLMGRYENFIPLQIVRVPTRWDGCWTGMVVDSAKFAETDFGRELLHYAPHLFEYGKEKAKNG